MSLYQENFEVISLTYVKILKDRTLSFTSKLLYNDWLHLKENSISVDSWRVACGKTGIPKWHVLNATLLPI